MIDSGIDIAHPDLVGRVARGYLARVGGSDITDLDGHGTFVAGLISAIDGNGLGIKGVAGNTPLYGIRAPTLLVSEIADAIVWAVDNGARVINLSLGGDERSAVVTSAIDYALDRNVLVVAAAGNSGDADNSAVYPAADIGGVQGGFSRGLSVAAVRPDLQHAAFSTSNDFVSVAAPGAAMGDCRFGVFSTIPASSGVTSWDEPFSCAVVYGLAHVDAGRWAYAAGTSFSAPIVSGIAALALAVNPGLRNDQLATVLKRSASGSPDAGWNQRTGWGVVNAARAVGLAQRFDMLPPSVELKVKQRVRALRVSLNTSDQVAAGGDLAPAAVTRMLEISSDGVNYEELKIPAGTSPVAQTVRVPSKSTRWLRATACDGNLNCQVATTRPLKPLLAKPLMRLKVKKRAGKRIVLQLTWAKAAGLVGKGKVIFEWRKKRLWRQAAKKKVRFGQKTRIVVRANNAGKYRFRAKLKAGRDWRARSSNIATKAVPARAFR